MPPETRAHPANAILQLIVNPFLKRMFSASTPIPWYWEGTFATHQEIQGAAK
jgi:hypothetical protein